MAMTFVQKAEALTQAGYVRALHAVARGRKARLKGRKFEADFWDSACLIERNYANDMKALWQQVRPDSKLVR